MFRSVVRATLALALLGWSSLTAAAEIPRPEHPTPDAVRPHWENLNGQWQFRFDPKDEGQKEGWEKPDAKGFDQSIVVPFPWESELSTIKRPDYHGVAWYRREFRVPESFPKSERVWLRFGAVDYRADVWVNGKYLVRHEGGYTPFEIEVTEALKLSGDKPSVVTVRVFDPTDPALPTGKQVGWYTSTSGIWQTVWLEARPSSFIDSWAVETKIDPGQATFRVKIGGPSQGKFDVAVSLDGSEQSANTVKQSKELTINDLVRGDGPAPVELVLTVPDPRLWSPDSPHLYNATITLTSPDGSTDRVKTYFGLRTIARGKYGDAPFERILLNGKPLYLSAALDQSFNPKGIYTAPDDAFLKNDIALAKSFGLNALRIHIKPDEPRRLYWADKLGVLILEDMPNTWRQNDVARKAWQHTAIGVVKRDCNHPSIITWVAFNETWGLGSPDDYKKDKSTQEWVGRMVDMIRRLDGTRLVEDNSPCNYDHVENTDLNSWHFYIDDHEGAARHIDEVVTKTEPGSGFNYCPGRVQGTAPLINSEYGGVSAGGGDRDVSWCFRDLTTILRRQPKIQGYVYTELADIEWEHNGFVNYDRSPKDFGYEAFLPGMTPKDLNGPDFIGYGGPPAQVVKPGEKVTVPLFVSHYSERKGTPSLRFTVTGWHDGDSFEVAKGDRPVKWTAYGVNDIEPLTFTAPDKSFVGAVAVELLDENGKRIAANFQNLVIKPEKAAPRVERKSDHEAVLRFEPEDFARRHWSGVSTNRVGKASGQGTGWFEYHLKLPDVVSKAKPESVEFVFEAGSKAGSKKVDWPERLDLSQDYPQTDIRKWPSCLQMSINGTNSGAQWRLEDDPADARGVLSHLNGVEQGSYGRLFRLSSELAASTRAELAEGKTLVLKLEVPGPPCEPGGLSLYGATTGRYPVDPTIVIKTKDALPSDLGVKTDEHVTLDRMADRYINVLGTGDSGKPAEWAFTTKEPGKDWSRSDFDDSGWSHGKAGFGTGGTPAVRVGTNWDTDRIWLRKAVELPKLGGDDMLTLRIFHDEDAEVFVNGKSLVRTEGYISSYRDIELSADQKTLFHAGKNIIAVSCRQSRGGQGIDVGLTLQKGE